MKTRENKKIASGAEGFRNKGRRKETIRKEGKKKAENYKQRKRSGGQRPPVSSSGTQDTARQNSSPQQRKGRGDVNTPGLPIPPLRSSDAGPGGS